MASGGDGSSVTPKPETSRSDKREDEMTYQEMTAKIARLKAVKINMARKQGKRVISIDEFNIFLDEEYMPGAFGKIYNGKDDILGPVSVKMVKLPAMLTDSDISDFQAEAQNLQKVERHGNIVDLILPYIHVKDGFFYTVTNQLSGGNLTRYLQNNKQTRLSDAMKWKNTIAIFSKQIMEGIAFLEKQEIVHCALSTDTVYLSSEGGPPEDIILKVGDFSKSSDLGLDNFRAQSSDCHSVALAPELIDPEQYKTEENKAIDRWSLGIIMYQMEKDAPLLKDCLNLPQHEFYEAVTSFYKSKLGMHLKSELPYVYEKSSHHNIIGRLLKYKSEERLTYEEFVTHKFINPNGIATRSNLRNCMKSSVKQGMRLSRKKLEKMGLVHDLDEVLLMIAAGTLKIGDVLWLKRIKKQIRFWHVGIYIGNNRVVELTRRDDGQSEVKDSTLEEFFNPGKELVPDACKVRKVQAAVVSYDSVFLGYMTPHDSMAYRMMSCRLAQNCVGLTYPYDLIVANCELFVTLLIALTIAYKCKAQQPTSCLSDTVNSMLQSVLDRSQKTEKSARPHGLNTRIQEGEMVDHFLGLFPNIVRKGITLAQPDQYRGLRDKMMTKIRASCRSGNPYITQ